MSRGIFLVIEGPNRAGKSTLIAELSAHLRQAARTVLVTREPGGTPMGEGLRGVLKNSAMAGGAFATALVFNGGRKEHADKVIVPAVARGEIVICDRYYMSTEIFQCTLTDEVTSAEKELLRGIHRSFPQPDLTVFLLPTIEVVSKRGAGTETDRFEGNPLEMKAYDEYAREFARTHPAVIIRPVLATEGRSKLEELLEHPLFREIASI